MPRHRLRNARDQHVDRLARTCANALRSIRTIHASDPRLVHFQLLTPVVDRWWIPWLSGRRVRVMTVHNVEPHERSSATSPGLQEAIYRAMDALIVHAHANKHRLEELHPGLGKKVTVIPHAIWQVFPTGDRLAARRSLGLAVDRPVILFFGVIRKNKGLGLLIDSLAALRESMRPLPTLVVAGQPTAADGSDSYANQIRALDSRTRSSRTSSAFLTRRCRCIIPPRRRRRAAVRTQLPGPERHSCRRHAHRRAARRDRRRRHR